MEKTMIENINENGYGIIIEKDWITKAGFRAVCIINVRDNMQSHRCGYVAVSKDHPFYGLGYDEQSDFITQELADNQTIGQKGYMVTFTAMAKSDDDVNKIRRSPDIVIDCHGGLTYSSILENNDYPVQNDPDNPLWWFGFDCSHCGDKRIDPRIENFDSPEATVKSLYFVEEQCESIAEQLAQFKS